MVQPWEINRPWCSHGKSTDKFQALTGRLILRSKPRGATAPYAVTRSSSAEPEKNSKQLLTETFLPYLQKICKNAEPKRSCPHSFEWPPRCWRCGSSFCPWPRPARPCMPGFTRNQIAPPTVPTKRARMAMRRTQPRHRVARDTIAPSPSCRAHRWLPVSFPFRRLRIALAVMSRRSKQASGRTDTIRPCKRGHPLLKSEFDPNEAVQQTGGSLSLT